MFPAAHIMGCSTGGQINNNDVNDDEIVAAAISFDATRLQLCRQDIGDPQGSRAYGEALGRELHSADLAGVFVLSDGLNVNGSELVAGISKVIGGDIPLTGGLAGDGANFKETLVGADCAPRARTIAALGFYGTAIRVGHGSAGGWDLFGPRRHVTKSAGNVLFELDGEPALDLYERYLGPDESKGLPSSALLFPIQVYDLNRPDSAVVRTVLAIDREQPFNDLRRRYSARLDGAIDARKSGSSCGRRGRCGAAGPIGLKVADGEPALLHSGELHRPAVADGPANHRRGRGGRRGARSRYVRLGFYSYGEISPHAKSGHCELHNQTMTVTTLAEVA